MALFGDGAADRWGEHSHPRLESSHGQRDLRRQVSHWKTGRNYVVDRLVLEYIDGKTSNLFLFKRPDQRCLFNQRSARSIDQMGRTLHQCELGLSDNSASLCAKHQMDGQKISLSK